MPMPSNPAANPESLAALWRTVYASLALLAPPPALTVSEWADKFAVLPREGSAEPGPWRTDRAPYQRELMDVVNDPAIETVAYMIASQLGKTAGELNTIFYFAHKDPSPMLLVLPTEKQAEDLSKERISTAIRDTPALRGIFPDVKSRDAGNTMLNKSFPGGYLAMAGANAPRGLASRSIRILIMDEIDGMPASSGTEGDPITLAEARTTNFWNRKKLYSSTPTIKGASRIEKLYEQSDMRRYFVPCPHCGVEQVLEWESLTWPGKGKEGARQDSTACYYVCLSSCEILEAEKPAMLRAGRWVKTNPNPSPRTAGFQLSSLYSPWLKWPEIIESFLKAAKNPELLKAFTNTRLGRTYEMTGETVDEKALINRRVVYPARVPAGALVLTCGVDVQANRIEYEIVGWGENDRSWSIDYGVLRGNPALPELWAQLDDVLRAPYRHASGTTLRIKCAFVDSGFHTKQVYAFCRPRQVNRVFASKGIGGTGVPLLKARPQSRVHRGSRVELRLVGIDTAKESLYANLQVESDGTGYCAFPLAYLDERGIRHELPLYDQEFFEQLTGEKLITEMDGMTPVRKWVKKRERNEALDCRVYATAALEDLNVDWKKLATNMGTRTRRIVETEEIAEEMTQQAAVSSQRKPARMPKKRLRLPNFGLA